MYWSGQASARPHALLHHKQKKGALPCGSAPSSKPPSGLPVTPGRAATCIARPEDICCCGTLRSLLPEPACHYCCVEDTLAVTPIGQYQELPDIALFGLRKFLSPVATTLKPPGTPGHQGFATDQISDLDILNDCLCHPELGVKVVSRADSTGGATFQIELGAANRSSPCPKSPSLPLQVSARHLRTCPSRRDADAMCAFLIACGAWIPPTPPN